MVTSIKHITDREMEVAELISECLTNKGIASKLGISEQTVKNHVQSIALKLGFDNEQKHPRMCIFDWVVRNRKQEKNTKVHVIYFIEEF